MEGEVDESLATQPRPRRDDRGPARDATSSGSRTAARSSRTRSAERESSPLPTRDFEQVISIGAAGARPAPARELAARAGRGCSAPAPRARSCTATHGRWRTGSARTRSCSTGASRRCRCDAPESVTAKRGQRVAARRSVARDASYFPTRVTGAAARHARARTIRDLALAVNGRIRAVGRSFDLWKKRRGVLLLHGPGDARCAAGANRVELFEVRPGGTLVAALRHPVDGVRLGAPVDVHVRRLLARVDERAEVAVALVARHAGAEEVLAEPDGVRGLEVSDQLLVPASQDRARGTPRRCARCPPSRRRPSGATQARRPRARPRSRAAVRCPSGPSAPRAGRAAASRSRRPAGASRRCRRAARARSPRSPRG